MFAQRRIMTELLGEPYTCLEASTGQALLRQHIEATGNVGIQCNNEAGNVGIHCHIEATGRCH